MKHERGIPSFGSQMFLDLQEGINNMGLREFVYDHSPVILQNIYIWAGRSLENRRIMRYVPELSAELEKTERYSRAELTELQLERLKLLVRFAYENVPYYRTLFDSKRLRPSDIRKIEDIVKIPILDKKIVRENSEKLVSRVLDSREVWHCHTSGTTGSPLSFIMDLRTQGYYQAHIIRHRRWFGYLYREYCESFGGKKIIPNGAKRGPFWRYDLPDKLIVFSTFHLDPQTMEQFISVIREKQIRFLKGYPSNLYIFAKYLTETHRVLPMKAVFTGAEPLYPYMKSVIEAAFQCDIADFYGQSEEVARAYECPKHEGYHVAMESTLIEMVDDKGEPSNAGEIVGTSLTNFAMPFIRYRTGDVSSFVEGKCSCGREHIRIQQVQTKLEDIVITKSGRWLSPSNLTHPFKPIDPLAIERSQIVQKEEGKIVIFIQKGRTYTDNTAKTLLANFRERFGSELDVDVEVVDDIPIGGGRKFRWVKSERRSSSAFTALPQIGGQRQ